VGKRKATLPEKGGSQAGSSAMDDGPFLAGNSEGSVTAQAISHPKNYGVPTWQASLQRRADHPEVGLQPGADAIDGGDDRDGNTGRDQCVLDGGGAGLISPKSANCFHAIFVQPIVKALLNPIAEIRVYLTNFRQ
jgi:hypothetical protein